MSYAIVKTGGKQYRVQQGQTLLVERLPDAEGAKLELAPLMYRGDGDEVLLEADELSRVSVAATVVGHERGPKLRIVKFKPKRGYKRRTGHRQELTRIEITAVGLQARRAAKAAVEPAKPTPRKPAAKKPAARKPRAKPRQEDPDGS